MRLLLHICCAPCSIHPFSELLKNPDIKLTGFYFNPNIHPYDEYIRRKKALEEYSKKVKMEVVYPEYKPECFFEKILNKENKPARCIACWQMRLEETALAALKNGFGSFTTTLLISPYQDHMAVKEIGLELAERHKLKFYYQDFRTGFRASQNEAREHKLYRQKYCGCKFSEEERFKITNDKL